MKRAAADATEPVMKRVRNGVTEPVMTEREMERVMERVMDRVMEPVMQEMQEIKRLIESKQSAPADCNENPRPSLDQIKKSEEVEFQLVFANKLPDKIFTRDEIKDEIGESVQIKLINTISREIVVEDPHSSIEAEIVVIDSGFGFEENKSWTENEFIANIVRQREGKGPLVKGKKKIKLRDGVGTIDNYSFNDNSSWATKAMFRLGARVLQRNCMGQARIKEAISEAFAVRDYRMRDYPVKRSKKLNKQIEEQEVIEQKVSCMVDDERLNAAPVVNKGSIEVQNYKNHAPAFANPEPQALPIHNPVNAQREQNNSTFNPRTNNDCTFRSLNNNPTTGPQPHVFTVPHQGSVGVQKDSNHVPSPHMIGLSTSEETVLNIGLQPVAKSNCNPANAQGAQSNGLFHKPTNNDSGSDSHSLLQNSSQLNEHHYRPSPNNQAKVGTYRNPTTGLQPHVFTVPHQGFVGMQEDRNHVTSSHMIGLSTSEETVLNIGLQPVAKSTYNPANAEGAQSNGNFHKPTNDDSVSDSHCLLQNSYQLNEHHYRPSPNNLAEVGTYSNPTTGPQPHVFTVPHQGSVGMQKDSNHAPSSHMIGLSTSEETVLNIGLQPVAKSNCNPANAQWAQSNGLFHKPTNNDSGSDSHSLLQNLSQLNEHLYCPSPNNQAEVGTYSNPSTHPLLNQYQGSAAVLNEYCNRAMITTSSHVNDQSIISNDNHQPLNKDDLGWTLPQSKELHFFPYTEDIGLMIGSVQNNNQNTVMSPGTMNLCNSLQSKWT